MCVSEERACVCVRRAHPVRQVLFVPRRRRAAPPPQFDGRGAQQALDAAADRAASLRAHRAVSCRLAASLSG